MAIPFVSRVPCLYEETKQRRPSLFCFRWVLPSASIESLSLPLWTEGVALARLPAVAAVAVAAAAAHFGGLLRRGLSQETKGAENGARPSPR